MKPSALGIAIGVGITVYGVYDHWPAWVIALNVVWDIFWILNYLREN